MFNLMSKSAIVLSVVCLLCLEWTVAKSKSSEKRGKKHRFQTENVHLVDIPKKFELRGSEVIEEFAKIAGDVNDLTGDSGNVVYSIKVDMAKSSRKNMKKRFQHLKSKRYNKFHVPLSRKNMKLSAYELLMKKLADDYDNIQVQDIRQEPNIPTSTAEFQYVTTKQTPMGKYRPIIRRYRTNYTKVVRPVKSDIITLISHGYRHV